MIFYSLLQDKPWVFSHLIDIQKRLGKENFPLIEQHYFPNHKEMVSTTIIIIYNI